MFINIMTMVLVDLASHYYSRHYECHLTSTDGLCCKSCELQISIHFMATTTTNDYDSRQLVKTATDCWRPAKRPQKPPQAYKVGAGGRNVKEIKGIELNCERSCVSFAPEEHPSAINLPYYYCKFVVACLLVNGLMWATTTVAMMTFGVCVCVCRES